MIVAINDVFGGFNNWGLCHGAVSRILIGNKGLMKNVNITISLYKLQIEPIFIFFFRYTKRLKNIILQVYFHNL